MRRTHRRSGAAARAARLAAALFLATSGLGACGGCGWSRCSNLQFAPDARTVAFWRDSGDFAGFTVGPTPYGIGKDFISVYWCRADAPHRTRFIQIDSRGPFFPPKDPQEQVKGYRFAPDSSRVAIRTERRLLIADLDARELAELNIGDEVPHTVEWLANDEVVYATTVRFQATAGTAELRIYRQRLGAGEQRTRVYRSDFDVGRGRIFWSPNGVFVLLQATWRGPCRLLNTATAELKTIGPRVSDLQACAWRPDGAAAFCVFEYPTHGGVQPDKAGQQVLLLLEPQAGRAAELPHHLRFVMGLPRAEWTADGQYVLIDDGWAGGWLIRPRPWRAVALKEAVLRALRTCRAEITSWQSLHVYPVPGWLWISDHDGKCFAVNYGRGRCVPISEAKAWAYSPDGKRLAEVNDKADVTIRELSLTPSAYMPPRSPPATRPRTRLAKPLAKPATHPTTRPTTRPGPKG